MSLVQCSGCRKFFGNHGFSLHIAKTRDPRCQLALVVPCSPQISRSTLTGTHSLNSFASDTGVMDENDMSDDSDDLIDNAATGDADIFEILGESDCSAVAIPEQATSDEASISMPPSETTDQDSQSEAAIPEPSLGPSVVIDPFPHGRPGAPISQADHEASNSFIWEPFSSQRDWEVARWAKMRGATSSAMADLLAIPEVCFVFLRFRFITNA